MHIVIKLFHDAGRISILISCIFLVGCIDLTTKDRPRTSNTDPTPVDTPEIKPGAMLVFGAIKAQYLC
ncbi:MAG: hypothetical protein AB8B79_07515 [Granulosicoccus sp.]